MSGRARGIIKDTKHFGKAIKPCIQALHQALLMKVPLHGLSQTDMGWTWTSFTCCSPVRAARETQQSCQLAKRGKTERSGSSDPQQRRSQVLLFPSPRASFHKTSFPWQLASAPVQGEQKAELPPTLRKHAERKVWQSCHIITVFLSGL